MLVRSLLTLYLRLLLFIATLGAFDSKKKYRSTQSYNYDGSSRAASEISLGIFSMKQTESDAEIRKAGARRARNAPTTSSPAALYSSSLFLFALLIAAVE